MKKDSEYDVIVAGAGLAGVCAATAAARAGARVLAVEKAPYAGGVSTATVETSICNYFINTRHERVVGGLPLELVERMVERGAVHRNWDRHRGHVVFDVELGKLCMDEMMEDAGVEILFDTLVVDALAEDRRVSGLRIANRSGLGEVRAKCVVDATGDADVAARAGVPLEIAPMEHSLLFRLGNVDVDELAAYMRAHPEEHITGFDVSMSFEEFMAFYEDTGVLFFNHGCGRKMTVIQEAVKNGDLPDPWEDFRLMDVFQMHAMRQTGTMIVNTGFFKLSEPDGPAISKYLRKGRKLAHLAAGVLKEYLPGCSRSFVVATSDAPGLRRTRMLKTDYLMTREIYDSAPRYDDRIGRGVVVGKGELRVSDLVFDVPLRCVLPPDFDGLLIGSGRSASCKPGELLRTMPVTMTVGQGAGTVAAVAADAGVEPRAAGLEDVHAELRRQGVNVD